MSKLLRYELDAVIETVIERIREANVDSPEQILYKEENATINNLQTDFEEQLKTFKKSLIKSYEEKHPSFKFRTQYGNLYIDGKLEKPKSIVDSKQIEKEIIIANIKGDIEETIEKLVTKYTK